MKMWSPYEEVIRKYCPEDKIVYDEFHLVANFGRIIDEVRNEDLRRTKDSKKSNQKKQVFTFSKPG